MIYLFKTEFLNNLKFKVGILRLTRKGQGFLICSSTQKSVLCDKSLKDEKTQENSSPSNCSVNQRQKNIK